MIGNKIKQLRRKKGLSCNKLAQLSGHSVATIHSLEEGRSNNPGFKLVRDIAKVLGISLDEISKYI